MGAFESCPSEERKVAVLSKFPPTYTGVVSVAAEEGIPDVTLYILLKQSRQQVIFE